MEKHLSQAESDSSPEEAFNAAFDALWQIPDQDDDGYRRVQSGGTGQNFVEGQKVIYARTRGGAYKVGITLLERSAEVPRSITIDVMDYSEDIATIAFRPQTDPLGNREVSAAVIVPPVVALTEADQQFLSAIGMRDLVERPGVPVDNPLGGYQAAEYLAEPHQLATVGNLPQIIADYPL